MSQSSAALIAMHRCIYCRTNKADDGYKSCLQCRIERRNKKCTYSDEAKQKHKQWLKRRRDLLYAFGVCIICGKRDAKQGSHSCDRCIAKSRMRKEKKRREAGIFGRDSYTLNGKCYYCGEPVIDGKKTCQKHYEILLQNLLRVSELRKSKKGN